MENVDLTVQLRSFEKFLESVLLRDRRKCTITNTSLRSQISQYELVISELDKVSNSKVKGDSLLLEVIPGVERQATIASNVDKVIINVGCEVFVEFPILEALRFCYQKIYYLQKMLDSIIAKEVEIEALISKVTNTLEELKKTLSQ